MMVKPNSFVVTIAAIFVGAQLSNSFMLQPSTKESRLRARNHIITMVSKGGGGTDNLDNNRRSFIGGGFALPLAIALGANAPLIAIISKPPTTKEREEMLTEWCKTDYCTLLGGGAGFINDSGSVASGGIYDSDLELPSPEEYEARARLAAQQAGLEL